MNHLPACCGTMLWLALLSTPAPAQPPVFQEPPRYQPTDEEKGQIQSRSEELTRSLAKLRAQHAEASPRTADAIADVAICLKAADWITRHNEFYNKSYVRMTLDVLQRGLERAEELAAGRHPWTEATGGMVRGYVSKVDGSVQPYAIYVPEGYANAERMRLDVVLHGRGATLNEVSFFRSHDGRPMPESESGLVLHVFGRSNNAYRWAGEADVFEAIDAVVRNYRVDESRIVLRGFSMGGAGAWHLGLHYPDRWCAVEAGAGFSETKRYMNLKDLPTYQEKALHIYDALDVAENAFDVPIVGYGGEEDKQLQASVNIKEALEALGVRMVKDGLITRAEGIDFLHVIGAKTGHKVDPESAKVLQAFRDEHAARGRDPLPKRIRFTTYTLKYNRAPWLTIERLYEHYKKATVDAEIQDDIAIVTPNDNVAAIGVDRQVAETVQIGEQVFPLRGAVKGLLPQVYFRRTAAGWEMLDHDRSRALQENARRAKHHNLQGPIDDAFTGPFLCVRGTGTPWNPRVQAWADARLREFGRVWSQYLRGDLPIKDDTAITDDDLERYNLILFGDPGSNRLIAQMLGQLPLTWTNSEIILGGTFPSADHVPVLIAPSPLGRYRYVVLNSGHTFGAREFAGTNAGLFPRLGDYAVIKIGDKSSEEVRVSGYFDENWKPK